MYGLLIAEDELIERMVLKKTLEKRLGDQCRIFEAQNGREALEIFQKEDVRVVILDIAMPGMNGIEAAEAILGETERLEADIASRPLGRLRICASFGFGRTHIAPVVADFAKANPDVRVDLTLTDRPVSIIEEGFDVGIHLGVPHDSRLRARKLLANDRILCASPAYLETHGRPLLPSDLARHRLIEIAEDENTVGRWTLTHRKTKKVVNLAAVPVLRSNSGSAALDWCLAGLGIVLRSRWHAAAPLADGRLEEVLPDWHMPADVYAYFAAKKPSAQLRAFLDVMALRFEA